MTKELRKQMNEESTDDRDFPPKALLNQLRSGEREAFGKIVVHYQDRVYAMIMRSVGDQAIAKELSQETFLRAFKHIRAFRNDSSLSTWLIRIAINCTNSYFSSSTARFRAASDSIEALQTENPVDIQESFSALERIVIRRAVSELDPIYRSVVWLRSFEGLPYKEIAQVLDIPEGTVASRMNAALHLLKDKLKGEWS